MGAFNIEKVLELVDHNKFVAAEILQMFIDLTPQDFETMQKYFSENNIEQAGKIAHKMKSSLATLGFTTLSELAKNIELTAKSTPQSEAIKMNISQLGQGLSEAYETVKQELKLMSE